MKTSVKFIIVGGVLFTGGIVFGLGGTVMSMIEAFNAVGASDAGSAERLAEDISNALITTAIGLPVAVIGLGLSIGGIVAYYAGKNKYDASDENRLA